MSRKAKVLSLSKSLKEGISPTVGVSQWLDGSIKLSADVGLALDDLAEDAGGEAVCHIGGLGELIGSRGLFDVRVSSWLMKLSRVPVSGAGSIPLAGKARGTYLSSAQLPDAGRCPAVAQVTCRWANGRRPLGGCSRFGSRKWPLLKTTQMRTTVRISRYKAWM